MKQATPILPEQETEGAAMYPTSTLVATVTADRLRQAQTAREARAARRFRSVASRTVRAAMTDLAALTTGGRVEEANEYVRP
jgi:hypothetical protein